jgi:amino acid transporter
MSDNSSSSNPLSGLGSRISRPVQVIIVSSVMFTFISYWRTAAVVLCDLASTAYYIGGIVEGAIGSAAPWFILGVMLFSYAVRSIYIESCSLFVRGGVYRVVKEAMGGFLAKLSVSALMFDYILTGPTSAVSAGQYIIGLLLDTVSTIHPAWTLSHDSADFIRRWASVAIACGITIYFFMQNRRGIHESSGKALKIMIATTVMVVVMLIWCGVTLAVRGGSVNGIPTLQPDLSPKVEYEVVTGKDRVTGVEKPMWRRDAETGKLVPEMIPDPNAPGKFIAKPKPNEATGRQEDPLGFIGHWFPNFSQHLRAPGSWWSIIGVIGIMIAFGHSVLAMSGEETLAQVYREVESPKMPNFKKAAFIVFVYSLAFTATISFLAVLLIPDEVRMKDYSGNLIGGLAMYVVGPSYVRLMLNAFVVVIGFLILSGGVNTSMIGSNGVLNRVAEDGVMPDWFLRPHPRYGTTYRVLYMIAGLQLAVIILSRGNMYTLGEAYAFGVVWSFVFNALAMVVLRFKDRTPREFKVPFNVRFRGVELPIGLCIILAILLFTAIFNVLTKEVATIGGLIFTSVFFVIFWASERYHEKLRGSTTHKHLEQFNQRSAEELAPISIGLEKPYRKLVAIRSTQNLYMLEKTLAETDPLTTDVAVMTAQVTRRGDASLDAPDMDHYNRELMTAVVNRAETAGKHVQPLIVRTNNPLHSIVQTAKELHAQELVLGVSNIFNADEQIEQIAFYWINLFGGNPEPLTVRLLSRNRDLYFDLAGGNRIPKIGERQARSVAELREAGVGVSRILLVHYGNSTSSDLFTAALTMLDPLVSFHVVRIPLKSSDVETDWFQIDMQRAERLNREVEICELAPGEPNQQVVELARRLECGLILLIQLEAITHDTLQGLDFAYLSRNAPCTVCLAAAPAIPPDVAE